MKNLIFGLLLLLGSVLQPTSLMGAQPSEDALLQSLQIIVPLPEDTLRQASPLVEQPQHLPSTPVPHDPCPLFDAYPGLQKTLPHMNLIDAPTTVEKMEKLGAAIGLPNLYVKRDDLAGKMKNGVRNYGGNKPRKLKFLLPYALMLGTNAVTVWGCAGSNFAVATTWYARELGLKPILFLRPEPNSNAVRMNLKLMRAMDAEIHYCADKKDRAIKTAVAALRNRFDHGHFPLCMPTGGSNARGAIGFVDAIFELHQQIKAGAFPEPDYIVIASGNGSGGSVAGMLVGIRALGLKTKVIAVVTEPAHRDEIAGALAQLANETSSLLYESDSSFPAMTFTPTDLVVVTEFGGDDYGLFSKEGVAAAQVARELEGLKLDGTYTGKTFAALLGLQRQLPRNATVLYWHTYCSEPYEDLVAGVDYKQLPEELQKYFTEPVQPLDQ